MTSYLGREATLRPLLISVTLIMLAVHLWLAAHLELAFDEAYYALWARHLAWGYLDHPPMVAVWIRLSTMLFGNAEFGIRALGAIVSAAGSYLIYLLSWELMRNRTTAILAGIFYAASILIQVGAVIITPETPLVFFWSIALIGMAKIFRSRDARWWPVVGIAAGIALLSKYSAAFLGVSIVGMMIAVPSMRRWWRHPAPYASGLLAVALFIPVVLWNAHHEWASFAKQLGRSVPQDFTFRYLIEFAVSQSVLLNPVVAMLGCVGTWCAIRGTSSGPDEPRRLLLAAIIPMFLYFLVHSFHDRVEGNWPAPLYAPIAIVAADLVTQANEAYGRAAQLVRRMAVWALPVGMGLTAAIYVQAEAAPLKANASHDPTAQMAGWRTLGGTVYETAARAQAAYLLTSGYALTSELTIYGDARLPVFQFNERLRWIAFPQPDDRLFNQAGLYIADGANDKSAELRTRYARVTPFARLTRSRSGLPIGCYLVYVVQGSGGTVLDRPIAGGLPRRRSPDERRASKAAPTGPGGNEKCGGQEFDELQQH